MNQKIRRRSGLATVEAVLILPILPILTFGMIEYSWMFLKDQNLTNTARAGARVGATADGTNAQINAQITSLLTSYNLQNSGYTTTIRVNGAAGEAGTAIRGSMVEVEITVPYANMQVTGMSIFPLPATLHAKVAMKKEGH
jgi:Flp pilus assembly protein TadG